MARRHYHRDLLGTVFTIAGGTFVVGTWLLEQPFWTLLVAFGIVAAGTTYLARQLYADLTASETMFAAALVVAAMFGVRTWHSAGAIAAELAAWAGIAIASGTAGAWLAMQLPRSRWRPRVIVAGLVTMSAQVVPAMVTFALDAPEAAIILASVFGATFGGLVAIRVVPDAAIAHVFWGSTLAIYVLVVGPAALDGVWAMFGAMTVGAPMWGGFAALGAWIARPRRTEPATTLPEARAR